MEIVKETKEIAVTVVLTAEEARVLYRLAVGDLCESSPEAAQLRLDNGFVYDLETI
jgi:hypothetical protein